MSLHEFPALSNIPPDLSRSVTIGIDYNDTTRAAKLDLVIGSRSYTVFIGCSTVTVPDDLHPGAGDSTGVQSVQFSNMLILRPNSVE